MKQAATIDETQIGTRDEAVGVRNELIAASRPSLSTPTINHQLTLLDAGLELPPWRADEVSRADPPAAARRERVRQRTRGPLGASRTPPLPHQAPRGDLFRELSEQEWAVATAAQPDIQRPTREQGRAETYSRLAQSRVFQGKKKLKGPVEGLRRKVGSNRCVEFDLWLKQLRVKGASVTVRYCSLLSMISHEIDEIAIDFRYTDDIYGSLCDPIKDARARLNQAQTDVAELPKLFRDMQLLGQSSEAETKPSPESTHASTWSLLVWIVLHAVN